MVDRIYIICEGQSENSFVKEILIPYLGNTVGWKCNIFPYTVITSQDRAAGKIYRGGILSFEKVKGDILKCLQFGYPVTTMFDFFRLPKDFPLYKEDSKKATALQKLECLEVGLKNWVFEQNMEIKKGYFIPYLQMHEFEALFYCDLKVLKNQYLLDEEQENIDKLIESVNAIPPEEINHGDETAPSKRLEKCIDYRKGNAVVYPLQKIGIPMMREKCPHFSQWINRLEQLMR